MSATIALEAITQERSAERALANAARLWFVVAAVGQIIFFAYIVAFYGGNALRGNTAAWGKVLGSGGIVAGDAMGNTVLVVHLAFAAILTLGGLVQLIPAIRTWAPAFHRWNGRVYLAAAVLAALGGIYMVWSRVNYGSVAQHAATTLNGVLILVFAALALRHAMARDIATHRRWALRLFLAVSGVWFFRVGLMLWLLIHQKPVGFEPKSFTGPFLDFLSFASYLLPLAVLELYLRARPAGSPEVARWSVAALLVVLTIATGAGIFGASMAMWLPRI